MNLNSLVNGHNSTFTLNETISHLIHSDDESSDDEFETLSCFDSSSSSSDSSFESRPRKKLHRMKNYMETIEEYDDEEFKEHFRMNRTTCDFVIQQIESAKVLPQHVFGREKISAKKAFLITLWYLSNTETFRQVSDRFDVTKSSAHRVISTIVDFLVVNSKKYISWPNEERKQIIKKGFHKLNKIGGVVGAIDGTHINIKRPISEFAQVYYNRKGDYSILLQGVCDHRKKFLDVFCGEAGSMHDARLLKKSCLYEKGLNGFFVNEFLLGDSAYPCLDWLITPFKDNGNLSHNQKLFNHRHSATRIVIENAFGLLKGRFRRLKFFENNNIIFIVKCSVAATVLHNICLDFNDEIEYELVTDYEEWEEQFIEDVSGITATTSRREQIFRQMFD